jgi:hypothetical protein
MDCSCDALYGDTGLAPGALDRRKFAGMTNVSTPPRALDQVLWTSVTLGGVRAAQVGTDWTQSLQKAVHGTDRAEHR